MSQHNPLSIGDSSEEEDRSNAASRSRSGREPRKGNDYPSNQQSHSILFPEDFAQSLRRTHSHLKVSFTVPQRNRSSVPPSPLLPADVLSPQTRPTNGEATFQSRTHEMADPSSTAVLIYPKKIDDLRRFRLLFVGLLLFIVSSTQGLHSLFGTILMQTVYGYNVKQMTIVYLCGSSFGMFALPFGCLYDWFGPRIGIIVATCLTALGHLLFALMFGGHIAHTVSNSAIFYAMMSWGCYGLDVVVLPAVLTHMPRNRGQPTGLLKTFSGLGVSLISCMFRGFFNNHYDHLMWFMFAFTLAFGALGAWYLEDAPYVVNRWRQRKLTPRKVLRNYLIRNRYMSQLMPARRYSLVIVVMILMNFYLTIQAVVVAFKRADMTTGKYRGVAIGAVVITALTIVLIIPVRAIDGLSPQDKEVIKNAKLKEEELAQRREHWRMREWRRRHSAASVFSDNEQRGGGDDSTINASCDGGSVATAVHRPTTEDVAAVNKGDGEAKRQSTGSVSQDSTANNATVASSVAIDTDAQKRKLSLSHEPAEYNEDPDKVVAVPVASASGSVSRRGSVLSSPKLLQGVDPITPLSTSHSQRRRGLGLGASWHRAEPHTPCRPLLELHLDEDDDDAKDDDTSKTGATSNSASRRSMKKPPGNELPSKDPLRAHVVDDEGHSLSASTSAAQSPHLTASFAYAPHRPGGIGAPGKHIEVSTREPSTYNKPYFEAITICGEVFYTPVYQTTFLESLTYLDLWLIFYTTFAVWGVGLTMTANWNIQVMSLARWKDLDYKFYVLFASMSGVSTAGGRVFVGVYERVLGVVREKCGVDVVPTLAYPLASIGLLIGMILWIALPGDKVLVTAYIIGPAFYGFSTSFTPYVLGTIYDRDMGMHYGFIFLGAAIGQVFFFYLSWFLTYDNEAVMLPMLGRRCIGQRRCMNRAIGIYVAVVFSSILTSWFVHQRYAQLVEGKLKHRRVVKRAVCKALGRPLSEDANDVDKSVNRSRGKCSKKKNGSSSSHDPDEKRDELATPGVLSVESSVTQDSVERVAFPLRSDLPMPAGPPQALETGSRDARRAEAGMLAASLDSMDRCSVIAGDAATAVPRNPSGAALNHATSGSDMLGNATSDRTIEEEL